MKRVLVTGGSGKASRACVRELLEHGYEVINVDAARPAETLCPFIEADLSDFGQALEALSGVDSRHDQVDAVVHLAAIPAPGRSTNAVTFRNNILSMYNLSMYNVFEAARKLAIRNLVWASSETVLGLPFDEPPPYAPLDEEYSGRPETAYSLSKFLGEQMAQQFCRWDPELKIIGLRFSNVMEPPDYARFPSFETDPQFRRWNLWGYSQLGAEEAKLPRAQPSREYTSAHEGNTSRIAPGVEGAITSSSVLTGRETMTAELEVVVDRSVSGEELLRMPG